MVLTLEVIGEQAQDLGAAGRKVFEAIGGAIGRLPDNDWVFADPYISGRHALIRYLNGKYFIEDTSTNGVFLNSPDQRLSPAQPQQLKHGDVLFIDAYQIRVSIENDAESCRHNDPFANLRGGSAKAQIPRNSPAAAANEDRTVSLEMHPREGQDTEWFGVSALSQQQPALRAPPEPMHPAAVRTARSAVVAHRRASADDQGSPLDALLKAAGIGGLDPSSETAQTLGEVLRIAVGGVMEMLRARERMKDDLRMRGTSFRAAHNNPLKFSANVDDAFHNLLIKHNPAYLGPADAFRDAFRELRDHQAASLAAMRVAFEAMLARFDPDHLQAEFDRQMKKGSILGMPARLRYWDLYRDKCGALVKDAELCFRSLFGDEFAKVYEEQVERLRAAE